MAEIRINSTGELKLYDSDDSNYVSFKSGGTVSSNVTWTLPTADGSSGQVLSTNGSGTLSWATASSADPSSADGDSLGTASAEWSDLYLADGGVIYFGNDQEITLTHSADSGLLLKHTATADDKPINLVLQTGETDMQANDVIGKISWQAPDEGTGTDAILVSAAIQAVAEGNHSSSSNATSLQFMTGASEAAAEKMTLTSAGILNAGKIGCVGDHDLGSGLHVKTGDSGQSTLFQTTDNKLVLEDDGEVSMTLLGGTSSGAHICMGASDDADALRMTYDMDNNRFLLYTENSERFRITSNGQLLVGTSSNTAQGGNATLLQVENNSGSDNIAAFNNSNASPLGIGINYSGVSSGGGDGFIDTQDANDRRFIVEGTGNVKNTNNSYGSLSDERLKENIVDANSQWEDIKKIKFKNFNKKVVPGEKDSITQLGVIAQDLETAGMSGLVEENKPNKHDIKRSSDFGTLDKDGEIETTTGEKVKSVKYSVLLLKSAKALQEAITKIETLETKVKALEDA
jgi:hypothetical protein